MYILLFFIAYVCQIVLADEAAFGQIFIASNAGHLTPL